MLNWRMQTESLGEKKSSHPRLLAIALIGFIIRLLFIISAPFSQTALSLSQSHTHLFLTSLPTSSWGQDISPDSMVSSFPLFDQESLWESSRMLPIAETKS